MKIQKFQKGKIIRRIIGDIAEEYLDKSSVIQKIFKKGPEIPPVLKDLTKQYGDNFLTVEQALGLEDFSRYLLTKNKINLVFDPKTKLFSWQELPFEEAAKTWKHLPVMQENPVIKQGFTERFVPIEVPYRGGMLKRVHFPKSRLFEPDRNIVSPHIQFEWHRTPFDSYERSFLKPIMGQRIADEKIVYMPGHLYNMGLIPSHQAKSLYNLTTEGLDLSKMSRQGMFDTMKTVDDLVVPNAAYLSGDFVRGLDANAHPRDIPIGAELMQRYDSNPSLLPREVMEILNRNISGAQFSTIGKNLSTDSFKLIGDFGHKGNNGLRFGGWQNGFNSLGTQNKYLIDLTDAFKRNEISKNEYADKIREWMFQSFPQIQNYNPNDLVNTPYRYSPDVYIRHPFGLKGFKKGGKIEKHQKGKILQKVFNLSDLLGDISKASKNSPLDFSDWGKVHRLDMTKIPGNGSIVPKLSNSELGYLLYNRNSQILNGIKSRYAVFNGSNPMSVKKIKIFDSPGRNTGYLIPEYRDVVPGTVSTHYVENLTGGLSKGISEDSYNALMNITGMPLSANRIWKMPEITSKVYSKFRSGITNPNYKMTQEWLIDNLGSNTYKPKWWSPNLKWGDEWKYLEQRSAIDAGVQEGHGLNNVIDDFYEDVIRAPIEKVRPVIQGPTRFVPTKHEFLFQISPKTIQNGTPIVNWMNPNIWLKNGGIIK